VTAELRGQDQVDQAESEQEQRAHGAQRLVDVVELPGEVEVGIGMAIAHGVPGFAQPVVRLDRVDLVLVEVGFDGDRATQVPVADRTLAPAHCWNGTIALLGAGTTAVKLLGFETAAAACSVALLVDGHVIARFEIAPRRHAELALPWADALLAEAGIARSALDAV